MLLEWPPAVCAGDAEGVWEWTAAAGCVSRRFTIAELQVELRLLRRRPGSGFEWLPADLALEVYGPTGMGVRILDGGGADLGNVLIGYAGGDARDGGLRNTRKVGNRTIWSAPAYLSRQGFWCDPAGHVLTRARPRQIHARLEPRHGAREPAAPHLHRLGDRLEYGHANYAKALCRSRYDWRSKEGSSKRTRQRRRDRRSRIHCL